MEQLAAFAFGIALLGGGYDLLTRKIPNWITFSGAAVGLAAQIYFSGFVGGLHSLWGMGVALLLFLPIYIFQYMGAGDVKLLMAVGAWLDGLAIFYVAVGAILVGALYAFVEILYRRRLLAVAKNTFSFLRSVFVPGLVVEKIKLDESRKFAFGICIALSTAIYIFLKHEGKI
jgi:prepilin peptidase CpaA